MGIHRNGGLAEYLITHHIGGLAPHTGQGLQCVPIIGDLTVKFIEKFLRQGDDILGLIPPKAIGLDILR